MKNKFFVLLILVISIFGCRNEQPPKKNIEEKLNGWFKIQRSLRENAVLHDYLWPPYDIYLVSYENDSLGKKRNKGRYDVDGVVWPIYPVYYNNVHVKKENGEEYIIKSLEIFLYKKDGKWYAMRGDPFLSRHW